MLTPVAQSTLKLRIAFKHSTHILATSPDPVRISCCVSFWQTLQKRVACGRGAAFDEYPGHESIIWSPIEGIMLLVVELAQTVQYCAVLYLSSVCVLQHAMTFSAPSHRAAAARLLLM
jgi:hypothetical protein